MKFSKICDKNSELGLWGKLVKNILLGYQDICENDKQGLSQSL
jgi:hypothetical protein